VNYVVAGYGITLVVLAGYTARVLRRAKAISRALPEQRLEPGRQWQ
jgi:heme exporter protein CcmD